MVKTIKNKYIIAIILSILLHIFIYILFTNNKNEPLNKSIKSNQNKTTNLRYIQLKPKVIQKHKKPKVRKKVVQKKKKVIIKKPITKKIIKKEIPKKTISKPIIKPKVSKNDFNKVVKNKVKIDKQTQKLIDLYGDDFQKFDKQTKLFLIKNIKDIGAITKRFLSYPLLSIQAGQEGINVIEFILFPNGSIKDVIVSKSSGYFILDDNTMDTIYEAYEDYPRPQKPTLIKIFVKYELRAY